MELEIVSTIAVIYCYGYVIYYKLELRFHIFQGI